MKTIKLNIVSESQTETVLQNAEGHTFTFSHSLYEGFNDFLSGCGEIVEKEKFIVTYKEDGDDKELFWVVEAEDRAEAQVIFYKTHDVLCETISVEIYKPKYPSK